MRPMNHSKQSSSLLVCILHPTHNPPSVTCSARLWCRPLLDDTACVSAIPMTLRSMHEPSPLQSSRQASTEIRYDCSKSQQQAGKREYFMQSYIRLISKRARNTYTVSHLSLRRYVIITQRQALHVHFEYSSPNEATRPKPRP